MRVPTARDTGVTGPRGISGVNSDLDLVLLIGGRNPDVQPTKP
jgi:hypothetical protein